MDGEWSRNVGENKIVENQVPLIRLCWLQRFIDSKQRKVWQRSSQNIVRFAMDLNGERKARRGRKSCEMPSVLVPLASARLTDTHFCIIARENRRCTFSQRPIDLLCSSSSSSAAAWCFMLLFARCCLVYVIPHRHYVCSLESILDVIVAMEKNEFFSLACCFCRSKSVGTQLEFPFCGCHREQFSFVLFYHAEGFLRKWHSVFFVHKFTVQ